jgi:hypothetical protein
MNTEFGAEDINKQLFNSPQILDFILYISVM